MEVLKKGAVSVMHEKELYSAQGQADPGSSFGPPHPL